MNAPLALCLPRPYEHVTLNRCRGPAAAKMAGRTAARNLCNLSLRTASGPEGSSAKQILTCAAGHSGLRWDPLEC